MQLVSFDALRSFGIPGFRDQNDLVLPVKLCLRQIFVGGVPKGVPKILFLPEKVPAETDIGGIFLKNPLPRKAENDTA
jgi:hypothetical protein